MSEKTLCLPPPLSLLCHLDDRRHDRHGDENALICTLHDYTLAVWANVRWFMDVARKTFGGTR